MKRFTYMAGLSTAVAATMTMAVLAQTPQGAAQTPAAGAAGQEQVTVTGCVQREADYRKAHDAGRGGVAGTGVGGGNEFVLTNASMAKGGEAGATGTSGSAGTAYELTGTGEGDAGKYINKRVEIMGKLKPAETTASGRPTGGATAGEPPRGVDVGSKDLKLRELEVTSVKEASGSCPAAK